MADNSSSSSSGPAFPESESHQLVDHFFRHEYARLVAVLTRRFGIRHWELAEDAVQAALQKALGTWPRQGIPENPSGWLTRVAGNQAIDILRRQQRQHELSEVAEPAESSPASSHAVVDQEVTDDLLRMMFVCCDPGVPPESQLALALKTLCGFGHQEIARALLSTVASVAKRITRAKRSLRERDVELQDLTAASMQERLPQVQSVVYLLFHEGYSSTLSEQLIREELCEEAVRLALILAEHPTTAGAATAAFLALLLFHAARLDARLDESGAILLLKEQDRSQWDQRLLQEAFRWFRRSTQGAEITRYHAEACIAAEHCRSQSLETTNWQHIVQAYDVLCRVAPSPIHELNRAIAVGYREGAEQGLAALAKIDSTRLAGDYYLWHATRAELCRQTGDVDTAREELHQARQLAPTNAEKELISRKLDGLDESTDS